VFDSANLRCSVSSALKSSRQLSVWGNSEVGM
jgi:hypothetical protein